MEGLLVTRVERLITVSDATQVATARRTAIQCAEELRLSETISAKAALIATELATNLVKHGGGGSIAFGEHGRALVLIAIDRGAGIDNLAYAMRDGFSTAGSPGTGLGAISRAATLLDTYSLAGGGTAILCRIEDEAPAHTILDAPSRITVAGLCLPMHGEDDPGDAWVKVETRDSVTISVIDGLGHGPAAATAARAAVRVFAGAGDMPLERMLEDAHGALRPTRGAAVGIARIHAAQRRLDFAGVGNISAAIVSDEGSRRVVSLNGIVGHEMRKAQTFSYPWMPSSVLVMQSDGVSANWSSGAYPGLMQRDAALIAAVIYRDHSRGTDDATVVVAKAS
jgi:anti-sigma regulatory factor (Ser/Thr protein kinase)